MKKVLLVVLSILILGVIGCSAKSKGSNLTLQDFIKAYQNKGIEVDPENKPLFAMILAEDGVLFSIENKKVAIYQYTSEKKLQEAKNNIDFAKDWPSNGRFLLESNSQEAIEIFNNVK